VPYIEPSRRRALHQSQGPDTAGELNYAITRLCDRYLAIHGGVSYARVNEIVGVLECAKQEFYRRVAGPYEDRKLAANGDVYTEVHQ